MKFFADTANADELRDLNQTGLLDGVTTNPSLIQKSGRDFIEVITEIAQFVKGPISAETVSTDHETMLQEGLKLASLAPNIVVKVPLTIDGLKTCRALHERDIGVNVTLCFSASQALLAAKAGATYISPFLGRLDDLGQDGMLLIQQIRQIYDNYQFSTQILAASIRHALHVSRCALLGADVCTVPPTTIWKLFEHPLTSSGLETFLRDWQETKQSIL